MKRERGVALVVVLMAVALISALATSLALLTTIETRVVGNHERAQEARDAAEAAAEITGRELAGIADWSTVIGGGRQSALVDGSPGTRYLTDGTPLNLISLTAGLGDPAWRLFAHAPLASLNLPSTAYVSVWVRPAAGRPTLIELRADAFGYGGTRRAVLALVSSTGLFSLSEVR